MSTISTTHTPHVVEKRFRPPYVGDVLVAPDQIGSGKYDIKSTRDGQGRTFHEHQVKANLLLDFYLNYKKEFESIRSNLDVTAGYSWQSFRWQGQQPYPYQLRRIQQLPGISNKLLPQRPCSRQLLRTTQLRIHGQVSPYRDRTPRRYIALL